MISESDIESARDFLETIASNSQYVSPLRRRLAAEALAELAGEMAKKLRAEEKPAATKLGG
jgi:hypothetical protein